MTPLWTPPALGPATPVAASFAELPALGSVVVAIGAFDGVHRGHQYLLSQARDRAHSHGDALVVITFAPNPQLVLRPALRHFELTPPPLKVALLGQMRPDALVVLPFTRDLAATNADDFMDALEGRVRLREMWMGEDFAFGHRRSGNVAYLIARGQITGFSVHVIPREPWHDLAVSSTRIRQALADGEADLAADLLGRPLLIAGELSAPDLLRVPATQALPAPGAYAAQVWPAPSASPALPHGPGHGGVLRVPQSPTDAEGATLLRLIHDGPASNATTSITVQVAVMRRQGDV